MIIFIHHKQVHTDVFTLYSIVAMLLCVFLLLLTAFVCHLIKGLLTYLLTYMVAAKTINITEILINIQVTHLYKYRLSNHSRNNPLE